MRQPGPSRDQMPGVLRQAPAQHRRLIRRQGPSSQSPPDRGQDRLLAHQAWPARCALRIPGEERIALGRRQIAPIGPSASQRQSPENRPFLPPQKPQAQGRRTSRQPIQPGASREERPDTEIRFAPPRDLDGARIPAPANAASVSATECGPGRRFRTCHRMSRHSADGPPCPRRSGSGSAPRPSARDTPSHTRARRPRHRPDNGSCRPRNGYTAASPEIRCRSWPTGHCRPAPHGIPRAHPDRPPAARRWKTSCRRRNPGRSPIAPIPAAARCNPPIVGTHLLDAGQHDMHPRQRLRQIAIALIGDDDAAAGLGDQEIRAGDPDVRRQGTETATWSAPRSE